MAASNAFLNGFLGGMQAVNSMIDSQTRREYYKDQKERAAKEWEWKQQEQQQKQEQRQQKERLQNLTATYQMMNSLDDKDKQKEAAAVLFGKINENIPELVDNFKEGERAELSGARYGRDKDGRMMLVPKISVYDSKSGKFLRDGDLTRDREAGGPPMGVYPEDALDLLTNHPGLIDAPTAAQARILQLGGTLPKGTSGSGSGSGSKPTTYGKSWESENKDGTVTTHQVFRNPDGTYEQHDHNRGTGEIMVSPVSKKNASTLEEQFGGSGGGSTKGGGSGKGSTTQDTTTGPQPEVAAIEKGLKTTEAPKERPHWQKVLGDVTGLDAASEWFRNKIPAAGQKQLAGKAYIRQHGAIPTDQQLDEYMASGEMNKFPPKPVPFDPDYVPRAQRQPEAPPVVETTPKPEGPGVVELFKRGVTQPWQQGNGASFMSGVEQAAANRQQPLGSLPDKPPLTATPAPASSPPTIYDKAKQGLATTRQAAQTRQGLRASKQQQLEQVLKQARAIGKSKGKKALRQWLEDNYDEATIKELTGRLFPSFVSPSKRGMA